MASSLDDFISGIFGTQGNPLTTVNSNEFNGNSQDLLFTTDQTGLSISGGTTLTNISPTTAIQDAAQGKISLALLIWIALAALFIWWFSKQ